jgi:TonB family protein
MRFKYFAIPALLILFLCGFSPVNAGDNKYPGEDDFVLVDSPAQMIKEIAPVYPDSAKAQKIEGTVWVKALVDENGKVVTAKIARDSGRNCGFEKAALDAASKCEFTPAKKGDVAVPVWVTYRVEFNLAEVSDK